MDQPVAIESILAAYAPYKVTYHQVLSRAPQDIVFHDVYPVQLWGGGEVHLPLQRLTPELGIALLMTSEIDNQVMEILTSRLAQRIAHFQAETGEHIQAIAGIAKLGYSLAQQVSRELGHATWIPIDSSPKVWYVQELSVSSHSSTSGDLEKRMWIDPHIVGRVYRKTIAILDDAVNTGGSARAAIELARRAGATQVFFTPVFTEGHDWEAVLSQIGVHTQTHVASLGHLPLFQPHPTGGWTPLPETL
jgi:adenine/guanine phosphoribosyltransferase-like PRPP-binding protein